jgi:hypothetical protein
MYPIRTAIRIAAACAVVAGIVACTDEALDPVSTADAPPAAMSLNPNGPPAPGGLGAVSFAGNTLTAWPWTGRDFEATIADPLNILFTGDVDVLSLRAALRALDGDRTAFGMPDAFPFNCTWTDADGEMQSAYTDHAGWVANPVQLQCGDYSPMRFHMRLFPAGDWVVAGVHLDLLIPGTVQHRVISWELAEQLILIDFIRSGLVNPLTDVGQIALGPAGPAGDPIEAVIYNGLPETLQPLLGVAPDPSTGDYRAHSDGLATVFDIPARTPVVPDLTEWEQTFTFDQSIPRPFCNTGAGDWVHVYGPVTISTRVQVNEDGRLESHNMMRGTLDITSLVDGSSFRAQISQIDDTGVNAGGAHVSSVLEQKALPPGVGFLKTQLLAGPSGLAKSMRIERCD